MGLVVRLVFIGLAQIYKKNTHLIIASLIIGNFIVAYQRIKVKDIAACLFVLQIYLLSGFSHAQTQVEDLSEKKALFVGYAYSLVDKTLLYSEHHSISTDKNKQRLSSRVQYKSPEGILIADKTLQYDEQGYFPSFNFVDLRTRNILNVAAGDTRIEITHTQGSSGSEIEVVEAIPDSVMIADAGFDVFMMKNWQALVAGEAQVVEFLAPTRNMFVTFKIEQTFLNDSVVGFSLAPDNFFISLLVDTIYLEYDLLSGRILSYKGLTNIEEVVNGDASGSNVMAHIKYHYPELINSL
jgi:hypothetical protein